MKNRTLEDTFVKDNVLSVIFAFLLPVIILGFIVGFIVSCFKLGYDLAKDIINT
jgi:flagellar biosynthesis protein FliQ